jgi:inosine/xanthosine triphosphate pyrophosphatase family protein
MAQLPPNIKNQISHRARAAEKARVLLEKLAVRAGERLD